MPRFRLSPLRLHQIMYSLIYPAVLGSILYSVFESAASGRFELSKPMAWIAGPLFIALFTLDYTYSLAKEIQARYFEAEFLVDLLIVILMFIVANAIFGKNLFPKISIWIYLCALKLTVTVWEVRALSHAKRENKAPIPFKHVVSDVLLAIAYLLCGLFFFLFPGSLETLFLSMLFIVDGFLYIANTSDV